MLEKRTRRDWMPEKNIDELVDTIQGSHSTPHEMMDIIIIQEMKAQENRLLDCQNICRVQFGLKCTKPACEGTLRWRENEMLANRVSSQREKKTVDEPKVYCSEREIKDR